MERDWELCRKILEKAEGYEGIPRPGIPRIEGYTDEQIGYHCYLLEDAGLLNMVGPDHQTMKWESQRGGQTDAIACHLLCLLPGSSPQPVACTMNCYSKWPSA